MHFLAFPHTHEEATPGRFWPRAAMAIVALAAVWLVSRTIFFVDETEYVYVTQFGEPLRLCTEPGLGVKWPYQSLWRFDRRLQLFEPPPRELLTQDKENLNLEWYGCWRIPSTEFGERGERGKTDTETYVRRFLQSVGSRSAAETRLEERIQAALAAEVGRTRLSALVSLEPGGVQIEPMMQRITAEVRRAAADQFGIEIVDVRLKRFNYPDAVKPAVFAEIRSERQRVAVQYRAEGESEKMRLESQAMLARDRLLAQADREATRLRGEGQAKAIEIANAAHSKNPAFYQLLKTLDTYRTILDDQTTVILSADSPLLKLLTQGLPDLPEGSYSPDAPLPADTIGESPPPAGEKKAGAPAKAAASLRPSRTNATPTAPRPGGMP